MTAGSFYIGLDLGTSALKGLALRDDGSVACRVQAPYRTNRPAPQAAEQDPSDWVRATEHVIAELAHQTDPDRWAALGLSGMLPTLVTLDAQMVPIGPAITWEDGRAEAQASRLRDRMGAEKLYQLTGQWLDGRYLISMFERLLEQDRARAETTAVICSAKDYLFLHLTGTLATDPSTAAGYGCYGLESGSWLPELGADHLSGARFPAFPEVRAAMTTQLLSPSIRAATGLPAALQVCLGGADSVLGALGLGVQSDGEVAYVAGTSSVILGLSSQLVLDRTHRYLVTPTAQEATWGFEMDLLATGSAIAWLARVLLELATPEVIGELAQTLEPEDAPIFMPYLGGGEQGALWDPLLRGSLVGLELRHDRRHFARALLNGIVLESRRCLSVLEEAGLPPGTVHLAGGSAGLRGFAQDLADASRREVSYVSGQESDASALGAAVLARRAIGGAIGVPGSYVGDDAGRNGQQRVVLVPDTRRASMWDRLFVKHDRALAALRVYNDHESIGEAQGE